MPEFGEVSAAVRAAQERLLELRRQNGQTIHGRTSTPLQPLSRLTATLSSAPALPCPSAPALPCSSAPALPCSSAPALPCSSAPALPCSSAPALPCSPAPALPCPSAPALPCSSAPATWKGCATAGGATAGWATAVRVYPDIALGMLRRKKAAAGRVWLLLRHHDAAGRGRVAVDDALRLLAGDDSDRRICGRRQLGNLLTAGEGLFWMRDTDGDGRQWLRLASAARVAAGLGVPRLSISPVAVPLEALTGTIGQARAHLYAAFHSGRTRVELLGHKQARGPIARQTLCQLSGASANSQRNYERRADVGRHSAIAIGPPVKAADEHEMAWRRGRALFHLHDRPGKFGRPGTTYLAWQLPNEYTGPHAVLPRGRMKRLNRALADLFHNGMTGNGEPPAVAPPAVAPPAAAPPAVAPPAVAQPSVAQPFPVA
ncbi:MAG: hypothetical protein KBF17_13045, partial [Candidatus Promineofilum sp.]|nr:hypothetical protein [Promineifilum sp.]